jgi:alpha-ribazole phosphatase
MELKQWNSNNGTQTMELKQWNSNNETELKKWTDDFVTEFTPNGESFEALNQRVIDFWQENVEKNIKSEKGKIALIVCHAGAIRSILCHVLQISLQKAFSVSIDYGSISKLKVSKTHVQVEFLNG